MFDELWLLKDGTYALWTENKPWRLGNAGASGGVYRAKVERPTPALGGAFVSLGEQKALLQTAKTYMAGDLVAVQVVEPPKGGKLAVVIDRVGLDGRYLVYLPNERDVRYSARLAKADRDALSALNLPQGGFVVRSAARNAPHAAIEAEGEDLLARWRELPTHVGYLYEPKPDYGALVALAKETLCDDPVLSQTLGARYVPALGDRFAGVDEPVRRTVSTPEGVTLIFDHTEAATVVDVNSGAFVPALSSVQAADSANRIAAKELVRQLLLRDVTGMILADFVTVPKEQGKALLRYLESLAVQYDSRLHVVDYTKLGIVELTREAHSSQRR